MIDVPCVCGAPLVTLYVDGATCIVRCSLCLKVWDWYKVEGNASLIDRLAALEHEQWVSWSRSLSQSEKLSKERLDRWERLWVPYEELREADKEQDRVWARKVLKEIGSYEEQRKGEYRSQRTTPRTPKGVSGETNATAGFTTGADGDSPVTPPKPPTTPTSRATGEETVAPERASKYCPKHPGNLFLYGEKDKCVKCILDDGK